MFCISCNYFCKIVLEICKESQNISSLRNDLAHSVGLVQFVFLFIWAYFVIFSIYLVCYEFSFLVAHIVTQASEGLALVDILGVSAVFSTLC